MKLRTNLLLILLVFCSIQLVYSQSKDDFFGKLHTVVIDAGHGGKDKGCLGSESYEKDVALAIALKLGGYLEETYEDLNVIFTRKTDVFVELQDRASIANKAKADLFICIHANAGSSSAYGTETFVMGDAKSESNMKAAQRENSVILMEDNYETKYDDFDPNSPASYIIFNFSSKAHQAQSISFAEKIQGQFRERVGRKDRGVKTAGFLVLHQTTMPSVLIETGFLTNRNEEKFLTSTQGQDYLASAIYRAFKEYKKEVESVSQSIVDDSVNEDAKVEEGKGNETQEELKKEKVEKKEVKIEKKGERTVLEGLVFKVQIATSTNKMELVPENFNGLEGIDYYEAGGLYRYTYGEEGNWAAANELQKKLKENGYEDSFVVAFHNGKRIAVGEAVKILKKDK
jgi:N-acetylmuramoyl-L-alanine amidase